VDWAHDEFTSCSVDILPALGVLGSVLVHLRSASTAAPSQYHMHTTTEHILLLLLRDLMNHNFISLSYRI
jgi:hypothetical protein